MRSCAVLATALFCACAYGRPEPAWTLVKSEHFEIYSQGDEARARTALVWFEQLRAFFQQRTALKVDSDAPVRVIGFRSPVEYQPFRLRSTADAYYVGTGNRNYIVMATLDAGSFGIAAHEYAHFILHASGVQVPHWLSEGLAELFSTVRIGTRGCSLGGDLPMRSQVLRSRSWMPLSELLALPDETGNHNTVNQSSRADEDLFYAEAWSLTEMLVLSPEYGPRFHDLMAALTSGAASAEAMTTVYGKPLEAITSDAHAWANRKATGIALPGIVSVGIASKVSEVSSSESRLVLAELLFASGETSRAEALYRDLAREAPGSANVLAALGAIALRQGDRDTAREQWKRAIAAGINDASLCYRYAQLAADAGLPASEIRPALERALALDPRFDDARYELALLESNAGHYEAALAQFRAMRSVAAGRAYAYWCAIANAETELGHRDEAKAAVQKAMEHAKTAADRERAASLRYMAETDLAVRFTRDASGQTQMVTTRVPHGTQDFNPFIEPQDHIRRVEGKLREIHCVAGQATGVAVDTAAGALLLAIPDPMHVLMRNAPAEFVCGAQAPRTVELEYAASEIKAANTAGVVRGMEFR